MNQEQLGNSVRNLRFTKPELHLASPDLQEEEVLRGRIEDIDFYVSWHMGRIDQGADFPVVRLAVANVMNKETESTIINTFIGLTPELKLVSEMPEDIEGKKINRYCLSTDEEGLRIMLEREKICKVIF